MNRFEFADAIEQQLKMGAVDLRRDKGSRFLFTIQTRDYARQLGFDDPGYFMQVQARAVIEAVDGLVHAGDQDLTSILYKSAEVVADGLYLLNKPNPIYGNISYANRAVDLELASVEHLGANASASFFQALTGSFLQKIK